MSKINFSTYIPELINTLIFSTKGSDTNIKLNLSIEEKYFTINTAIPLGLLINEIVTNSLKHGIKGNEKGEINISLKKKTNKKMALRIGDNGIGYKNNFVAKDITTLGFQLILSLVEQLNGIIEKEKTSKGTYYNIIFEKI
ncbi:MAG: sensor histidine kinase [Bacteroidetes bacterium]|nr:sensor histidine kinase [Bacteroidota bacterium]